MKQSRETQPPSACPNGQADAGSDKGYPENAAIRKANPIHVKKETDDRTSTEDSIVKKIGAGAVISFAGNVLRLIFNILFFGLVTRYINKEEFGALSLALAFINVVTVISCLGINRILPGFIAENLEKKAFSRIRGSLFSSYGLTLCVALTLSTILFFSAELLSELLNKPVFAGVLRQMAVIIPFATSIDMMVSYLQSFHNVWGMQFKESVQPFIRVVLTALFIMLNLSFTSIVMAYVLSVILSALGLAVYIRKKIPNHIIRRKSVPVTRELIKDAYPLLIMGLIEMAMVWSGILFIGVYLTSEKVGIFSAGMRLALLLRLPYISTGFIFIPVASQLYYQHKPAELKRLYESCTKGLITLTLPFFFFFFLTPNDTMGCFFGPQYNHGNAFFSVLCLGYMIHVLVGLSEFALIAIKKNRPILICSAASALCNLTLNYLLIPSWGMMGAAVSLCISVVLSNILTLFYVYRYTNIHPFAKSYHKLVWPSACVLIFLFFTQYTRQIHLNPFVCLILGVFTISATLFITRNFEPEDIILLRLLEKKITKKTLWSDRLAQKLNQ